MSFFFQRDSKSQHYQHVIPRRRACSIGSATQDANKSSSKRVRSAKRYWRPKSPANHQAQKKAWDLCANLIVFFIWNHLKLVNVLGVLRCSFLSPSSGWEQTLHLQVYGQLLLREPPAKRKGTGFLCPSTHDAKSQAYVIKCSRLWAMQNHPFATTGRIVLCKASSIEIRDQRRWHCTFLVKRGALCPRYGQNSQKLRLSVAFQIFSGMFDFILTSTQTAGAHLSTELALLWNPKHTHLPAPNGTERCRSFDLPERCRPARLAWNPSGRRCAEHGKLPMTQPLVIKLFLPTLLDQHEKSDHHGSSNVILKHLCYRKMKSLLKEPIAQSKQFLPTNPN